MFCDPWNSNEKEYPSNEWNFNNECEKPKLSDFFKKDNDSNDNNSGGTIHIVNR